jgi:hypothetical protein
MKKEERQPQNQPYEKPMAKQLMQEQAKLKLLGHAMMGSEPAKELLEIVFFQRKERKPKEKQEKESG